MQLRRPQFVVLAAFGVSVANGLIVVAIPLLAKERFGVSAAMLGAYGAAQSVPYIFSAWAGGRLSERWGRRFGVTLALAVMTLGFLLILLCRRPAHLYLPSVLIGIATGTFWSGIEAAMSDGQLPSQIKRAAAFFSCGWMSGLAVGPALGGYLYQINYRILPIAAAAIVAVLILLANLPRTMQIAPWGCSPEHFERDRTVSPRKRSLFIQLAFLANVTSFFMVSSFRALLAEYTNLRHFPGWQYGLLQAGVTAGMVVTVLAIARRHGWHYSLRFLIVAEACAAALLVAFCLTDSYPLLLLLGVLFGLPVGVTYFSSIYYGLEQLENKGAHSGNHEAVIGVGAAIGPVAGAAAIAWSAAPRANLILSAGVYAAVIVVQVAVARARLRSSRPQPDLPLP